MKQSYHNKYINKTEKVLTVLQNLEKDKILQEGKGVKRMEREIIDERIRMIKFIIFF